MNAPIDVLDVMDHYIGAFADHDERYAQAVELKKVRDAVAELIEAAGKAQDTNREDFALARPDVSGLSESERAVFLRGWAAASEAVYRTGLRSTLARVGGVL